MVLFLGVPNVSKKNWWWANQSGSLREIYKNKMKLGCCPQQTNISIKCTPILKRDANHTTSENGEKKTLQNALSNKIWNL